MFVQSDFSKSEDLKMEINFSKGAVNLVLEDVENKVSVVLNHADFSALQKFIGLKKEQERERRIKIIIENPNAYDECGFRPGSLDEKLFNYAEKDWACDL